MRLQKNCCSELGCAKWILTDKQFTLGSQQKGWCVHEIYSRDKDCYIYPIISKFMNNEVKSSVLFLVSAISFACQ